MNIKQTIEALQKLINEGANEETQVMILSSNGIQLSKIESIEAGKSVIHIVESK